MNKGVLYSLTLHIILFLLIYFGLPTLMPNPPEELVISVEILPVSEISNIQHKHEQQEVTKVKEEKKSNKDIPNSVKKEEKANEEIKQQDTKPKPKEEKKEDKPNLIIKEAPKPEEKLKKEEDKSKEKVKEKLKDIPKEKKEKKKEKLDEVSELDSLLKTLEKPQQKSKDDEKKSKEDSKINQEAQKKSQGKYNENLPLSISEKDTIGNQIYNSWYFQAGAKDSKDMFVVLKISVSQDGTVTLIEIVDMNKYNNGSTHYKTFVDSAVRAVKKASPFTNLSVERYSAWKELELNFDPRGVIF